ncbi:MAG TPA: ribosome-associated translation inhibitor RaiA [Mycobacteriales bacterium]|nr:ribosome-associated translation inhibitor RaiA [Mycobacteriales bacterium]
MVKGRHLSLDVGESFRQHCVEKLARLERLDQRLMRLDVELSHEPNRRQQSSAERVEITVRTRGPVVRAEAAATDCYAAFEKAYGKLEERLRRAASKRTASHSHSHHAHVPNGTAEPTTAPASNGSPSADEHELAPGEVEVGGLVVREKEHAAVPMRIEDALHAMELVGHDFYLFSDAETGLPSVVYRRKGYDYGVLRLTSPASAGAPAVPATA